MDIKQQDKILGEKSEKEVFLVLQKLYGYEFIRTCRGHVFDFITKDDDDECICKNIIIELKTRRVKRNKYNTTIVGINKIRDAKMYYELGYDVYFLFKFIDGLFEWKYQPERRYLIKRGGRCDRGKYEIKDYCHLYVCDLVKKKYRNIL